MVRSSSLLSFVLFASVASIAACGGAAADPPGSAPSGTDPNLPAGDAGTNAPAVDGGGGGGRDGQVPIDGPRITIALKGNVDPFVHVDGLAGETPVKQVVAIKSLLLLRSPNDPAPVTVFDHGSDAVPVDLVTGKPVVVAEVVAKTLPAGVFTIAKAGVSYVDYRVAARMHSGFDIDGHYDNVQTLSAGAVIGGVTRAKGYFKYTFVAGGTTIGALEGEDAPMPAVTTSGGLSIESTGTESYYVFPVTIAVDPEIAVDHAVLLDVNVRESFRWLDQNYPGYATGTFDTTPSAYEPVIAFGGNRFSLTIGPK